MSRVLIDTGLVHDSAKRVAAAQNEVGNAWTTLSAALSAAEGMAGNPGKDRAAAKFVTSYTPAVHAVWRGLATMHRVTGYMSRGLTETADNHAHADHASMINQHGIACRKPKISLPWESISTQLYGGMIFIYQAGIEKPVLTVPLRYPNAVLIPALFAALTS